MFHVVLGWAGGSAGGQVVATAGGPSVASKIDCHESFHGHAVGSWTVMRRTEVAILAGMLMMRRRIVAVVAPGVRAAGGGARGTGQVERDDGEDESGGVRVERPEGHAGEGGSLEASKTCSMIAGRDGFCPQRRCPSGLRRRW